MITNTFIRLCSDGRYWDDSWNASLCIRKSCGGTYYLSRRAQKAEKDQKEALKKLGAAGQTAAADQGEKTEQETLEDLLQVDTLELEVGYGLLPLIDSERGGRLPKRITSLRKQLATELGIVMPSVHLRDNLGMEANEYRILLRGVEMAKGIAYADRLMALDASGNKPDIDGIEAEEPAFGLPARWIKEDLRIQAETKGITVVDGPSVLTTHLAEILKKSAHRLVGRQDMQKS